MSAPWVPRPPSVPGCVPRRSSCACDPALPRAESLSPRSWPTCAWAQVHLRSASCGLSSCCVRDRVRLWPGLFPELPGELRDLPPEAPNPTSWDSGAFAFLSVRGWGHGAAHSCLQPRAGDAWHGG